MHHMLGLASVQAHTVLDPVRMDIRGLDLQAARQVFDELAHTVLVVQRAESAAHPTGSQGGGDELPAG